MTALSDRIAAEHQVDLHPVNGRDSDECFYVGDEVEERCRCGDRSPFAAHIADVTERAVRDTIAQQLAAARPDLRQYLGLWKRSDTLIDATTPDEAATDVLDNLTRIAREGTTP